MVRKNPGRNLSDLSGITVMELAPLVVKRRFRVIGATTGEQAVDALATLVQGCGRSEVVDHIVFAEPGVPNVWFVDVSPNSPSESVVDQAPTTVCAWTDLLVKLVHLRIGSPKESHDISVVPVVDSKVNGPVKTFTVYPSVDVCFGVDALVTGVSYDPPKLPIKVGDERKHERDVLFPHGRLRLMVDVFLDKPMGIHDVTERIDDEQNLRPQPA